MVELVRMSSSAQPSLLVWDGKKATVTRAVACHDRSYVPAAVEPSILNGLRLPPGSEPYGSTGDLFAAIADVFRAYGALSDSYARLATYFVFATHVADCLPTAPCLLITGSGDTEAIQLLRILAALCRHSLLLAGFRSAEFGELTTGLRPTLLLYSPQQSAAVERFLCLSHLQDFSVLGRKGLADFYCAKALYLGKTTSRKLFSESVLQIPAVPSCRQTPSWDRRTGTPIAADLQAKLLMYRLKNYGKVREAKFNVPEFTGPVRDLARNLGCCMVDDSELQGRIVSLLRGEDETVRVERSTQLESVVVESLLALCHEAQNGRVYIGEVTDFVNGILKGRGETMVVKAREIGPIIRSFRLFTKRDNSGYAFRMLSETRSRVHELARAYDVPTLRSGKEACCYCKATRSESLADAHRAHCVHSERPAARITMIAPAGQQIIAKKKGRHK